ncbi:hypothetical protein [Mucilaginibacter sp. HD30]
MTDENLKYPIGKFIVPDAYREELITQWKNDIKELPVLIKQAVAGLTDEQLETPYRTRRLDHKAGSAPRSG